MAVSGSRNFIYTRDKIIRDGLYKLGVLKLGENPTVDQIDVLSDALNIVQLAWHNKGVFLWTLSDSIQPLVQDTSQYTISSSPDVIAVENPFLKLNEVDTPISIQSLEDYKVNIGDKTTTGLVSKLLFFSTLSSSSIKLYPTPVNSTGCVTGTDALHYLCIQDHVASADTRPITGVDYANYWQVRSDISAYVATWVTGTSYHSDVIHYTKILRLQDFDASANNPDFPVQWYNALVHEFAANIAPSFGIDIEERKLLELKAMKLFEEAMSANRESVSLKIKPKR